VGGVLSTVLILIIAKPVYDNMYEDIFLKIGGNRNMWSNYKDTYINTSYRGIQILLLMQESDEARSIHQHRVHDYHFLPDV
jgi:hypothetical protein